MFRAALVILAAFAVPLGASCDKSSGAGDVDPSASTVGPSGSTRAASPAPPPTSAQAASPPLDDLDLGALRKALKCVGDAKSGPCRVVALMAACKEWNAIVPSGDGRWLGRGYYVEGSKTTEQVTLLRSKRVPSVEIAAGELPVKIAIAELAKEEGAAFDQAERAIRSYERGDVPQRSSPTLEYIKKREAWPDAPTARTAGGQVFINVPGGAYACQGAKQQVVLIRRSSAPGASADGLYAELWATSW